jgi:hypothetical protein
MSDDPGLYDPDMDPDMDEDGEEDLEQFTVSAELLADAGITSDEEWDALGPLPASWTVAPPAHPEVVTLDADERWELADEKADQALREKLALRKKLDEVLWRLDALQAHVIARPDPPAPTELEELERGAMALRALREAGVRLDADELRRRFPLLAIKSIIEAD